MITEYFKIAVQSIKKRGLRTWLTLIGILIGIAAVVSLIGIGQGLQVVVEEEFAALGANKILVQSSGSFFGMGEPPNPLTKDDVEALEQVSGVDIVTYVMWAPGRMDWADETQIGLVVGLPPGDKGELAQEFMQTKQLEMGVPLRENERGRAILGYNYGFSARYDTLLTPGRKIIINGEEFEVAGIKISEGNNEDNTIVFINEHDYEDLFKDNEALNIIVVEVLKGRIPADIVPGVEEALRKHRDLKLGQEDFEVETYENILESFLILLNVINAIIIGIASISLFVGAVGIMNTMYTAVLERTSEIGIMKSIGAKNSDIQNMFLMESGLLGLIGGIMGVLIGIGIGKIIEIIAADALGTDLLVPVFPLWLIIGSLVFAFVLGAVSGYLPARQAAKMNPVDALATE